MKLIIAIFLVLLLASSPGCKKSGGTLPPATSGNAPAGAAPNDEPAVSSSSYLQTETRTPIEYFGNSN